AERLAIAQERRTAEGVDLRAGIVDVELLGHLPAGLAQQVGQRVAEDRATRVRDMHRPSRIARDILDIDGRAAADIGIAVGRPGSEYLAQLAVPEARSEHEIAQNAPGN